MSRLRQVTRQVWIHLKTLSFGITTYLLLNLGFAHYTYIRFICYLLDMINSWIDPLLRIVSHWIPAGIELVPFDFESPGLLSVLRWKLNFLSIKFWNSIVVAQFLRLNFWSSNLEGQILKLNFWGSIFVTGPGLFSYMSPKEICLTTCKLEADILKEHF